MTSLGIMASLERLTTNTRMDYDPDAKTFITDKQRWQDMIKDMPGY